VELLEKLGQTDTATRHTPIGERRFSTLICCRLIIMFRVHLPRCSMISCTAAQISQPSLWYDLASDSCGGTRMEEWNDGATSPQPRHTHSRRRRQTAMWFLLHMASYSTKYGSDCMQCTGQCIGQPMQMIRHVTFLNDWGIAVPHFGSLL